MCMAGFLPFSAIYIELYYIFASVWGHKASALLLMGNGEERGEKWEVLAPWPCAGSRANGQ